MSHSTNWWQEHAAPIDTAIIDSAIQHQNQLTKPQGSLGRLEAIAIQLAGIQKNISPQADKVAITVFAGDHGIVAEGVSAYPQAVTTEMQKNFVAGGAAISVLSQALNAELEVINVGSLATASALPGVSHQVVAHGTENFAKKAAMTAQQLEQALAVGQKCIDQCAQRRVNIWVGGEMGIGNTTSATAIISELLRLNPQQVTGPGTGLSSSGVAHKAAVIAKALSLHQGNMDSAFHVLQHLGGFEIAALAGAYIRAAQLGMAAVVDGFICGSAALAAIKMNPSIAPYLLFSHRSAELGHQLLLDALKVEPIVDLTLRLGEGSGAALVIPLIQMATALHNNMATFANAGVSEKIEP
ncbi:MAG: nicotinate-nucleotide--dimethylbenzimidazole phosphoribosyltransferase [Gammaproteobacteria bacterium]|nr:MAG: nicotinate-nucleotide--dimethylbenzimidazole phosphoribosyltransferase [Gammaproteobacteria bacterium]